MRDAPGQPQSGDERQRAELYRSLFDLSPDPMIVHDGTRVVQFNRAAAELFGVDARDVDDLARADHIHPDYHDLVAGRVREMFETLQAPPLVEIRVVCADGSVVDVESSSSPLVAGDTPVIVTTLRDLAERKSREHDLRVSEARFRSVVGGAPLGMHFYELREDGSLVFVGANPAADAILGVDNSIFVGKPIEEAFPSLADTDVPARYREVARTGVTWSTNQVDYHEGAIRGAFEVHAFQTEPGHMAAMFSDVTERLQTQAQLQQLLAERTEALAEVHRELEGVIAIVSRMVELRDPYTAGHQQRVAQLVTAIARKLGLETEEVERMRIAGSVHDIGKLSVPAEILSKPGRLTAPEYEIVKCHAEAAHEILCSVEFGWPLAEMVFQHHERPNGSGYPRGIAGDEILLGARVLAVADVVEAMSSHRPYRPSIGVEEALAEITGNRGVLYDSDVVDACLAAFADGFVFE